MYWMKGCHQLERSTLCSARLHGTLLEAASMTDELKKRLECEWFRSPSNKKKKPDNGVKFPGYWMWRRVCKSVAESHAIHTRRGRFLTSNMPSVKLHAGQLTAHLTTLSHWGYGVILRMTLTRKWQGRKSTVRSTAAWTLLAEYMSCKDTKKKKNMWKSIVQNKLTKKYEYIQMNINKIKY